MNLDLGRTYALRCARRCARAPISGGADGYVIMTSDDALDCLSHQVRELRSRGVLGYDGEENMHVLAAQLSAMPSPMPPPMPAPSPWTGMGDGPPNTVPMPPPTPPRERHPSYAQHGAETPTNSTGLSPPRPGRHLAPGERPADSL